MQIPARLRLWPIPFDDSVPPVKTLRGPLSPSRPPLSICFWDQCPRSNDSPLVRPFYHCAFHSRAPTKQRQRQDSLWPFPFLHSLDRPTDRLTTRHNTPSPLLTRTIDRQSDHEKENNLARCTSFGLLFAHTTIYPPSQRPHTTYCVQAYFPLTETRVLLRFGTYPRPPPKKSWSRYSLVQSFLLHLPLFRSGRSLVGTLFPPSLRLTILHLCQTTTTASHPNSERLLSEPSTFSLKPCLPAPAVSIPVAEPGSLNGKSSHCNRRDA